MSGNRLLIIGAGGHGKVAGDCARSAGNWSEIVYFDDRWPELRTCGAWPVVGRIESVLDEAKANDQIFVAIGHASTRLAWLNRLRRMRLPIATIVHPLATVSTDVSLGEGTLVVAGAVVNIGTRIGAACIINTAATVDHDCVLADGVHICPGSHLAGEVTVGESTWIGIGSSVRQCLRIGQNVTVGAGAAVVCDVADGLTVVGVPARPLVTKDETRGA